jgi:flavin reductase (DIM6/NTAB) family NADH-FMN oxidoreductase RutF
MTIHSDHPFRDPESDPDRRLRGRLAGTVTLWTSQGTSQGDPRPAGLTVSSLMVAAGEPAYLLALLDPDSDLAEALAGSRVAVVSLLQWRHRPLAEVFAGLAPAPGGPFAQAAFVPTSWGPRLADAGSWAGVSLVEERTVGWSVLVTCEVQHVELDEQDEPLVHRRGRYLEPPRR